MASDKSQNQYILITSMNFPDGGAGGTYLNLFCRGLKNNGRSVRVLLLKGHAFGNYVYNGPKRNKTPEGVPYTYLGFKQRPNNKSLKIIDEFVSFCRLIIFLFSLVGKGKTTRILVYNSDLLFNIPIHFASKIFRFKIIKFVAEIIDRSEFPDSFFGKVKRFGYIFNYKYLNRSANKIIVFSSYLKDEYIRMGFKGNNIIVQPNLTDFDFWEPDSVELKYKLGYSGAPYLKDGLSDLFMAISLLKGSNLKINLLVIGDATFGESLIPALKAECQKLGIGDNVAYTGLVESSKVKSYLSECRILTITRPSTVQTKAGFPTKLGEYFATKKPVLATNFGDMAKYFTDGRDIVMAECGNPDSIARKILWMLQNEDELESISKRGYERARELLEYNKSVNRIINSLEIKHAN